MKPKDNKQATTLWLRPSTMDKVDAALPIAKCASRSEFAEQAFRYYIDHLITGDIHEYLSQELRDEFRKAAVENENRMRSLIFKWAVELNMLCHTIAAHYRVGYRRKRHSRINSTRQNTTPAQRVHADQGEVPQARHRLHLTDKRPPVGGALLPSLARRQEASPQHLCSQ